MEPLLQGAGGMFVYNAECLRVMREVADEHGLVLVFDEIATGFGRTGTLLHCGGGRGVRHADVMCVAKASPAATCRWPPYCAPARSPAGSQRRSPAC